MADLDVNGALAAVRAMMESWEYEGAGIGRVFDYIPDLDGEVPYREVMQYGNLLNTAWVIAESGVEVHTDDDQHSHSRRDDIDIEIQGFRPLERGNREAFRKWRDLYQYVLNRINERQYTQLGTDTPGSRRNAFSATDTKPRPITNVDHFNVVIGGKFLNAIVRAAPAAS